MMANLTVKELKAYVPAVDFEMSKEFYRALGFELTEVWGGSFDCRLGTAVFRLQNYYVKDWANNFMLQFEVEDARAWYDHVKPIIDTGKFGDARVAEPETVGGDSIITHVWDPSGVLLIFIQ
jgi:catechol 2,3-dioxygenase-like lactoylglutathione lyase family enzyme